MLTGDGARGSTALTGSKSGTRGERFSGGMIGSYVNLTSPESNSCPSCKRIPFRSRERAAGVGKEGGGRGGGGGPPRRSRPLKVSEQLVGGGRRAVGQALGLIHGEIRFFKDLPRLGQSPAEGEVEVAIDQPFEDEGVNRRAG